MSSPWRVPDEESIDLYPGLVVHDGRVSGSITTGQSRLPLWAFIATAIVHGWDEVEQGWSPGESYGWDEHKTAEFLHNLLEARGEFGRLLLVIADVERIEGEREDEFFGDGIEAVIYTSEENRENIEPDEGTLVLGFDEGPSPWWQQDDLRARVIDQLRRCLATLEASDE